MRLVFPLAIVMVAAQIGPIEAVRSPAAPQEYARIMHDAHIGIAAFGGDLPADGGLSYFFDPPRTFTGSASSSAG